MAEDKLTRVIDELVEQKTFSVEAAEGIAKLRSQAYQLEESNVKLNVRAQEDHDTITNLRAETERQKITLEKWEIREKGLLEREDKTHEMMRDRDIAKAESRTAIEMFKVVFAPYHMRKKITDQVVIPGEPGYSPQTHSTYREEETSEE